MQRGLRIPSITLLGTLLTISMVLAAGCGANPLASKAPRTPTAEETTALCEIVSRGTQSVSNTTSLTELANAKIQYFNELETVIPAAWEDNLVLIRPAWEKLVEVIEAAGGDTDKINFDKFLADFSDATANETAWEAYSALVCDPAGQSNGE